MLSFQSDAEIANSIYGKLTVIWRDHSRYKPGGAAYWLCWCECGHTLSTPLHPLRTKRTKSCGCEAIQTIAGLRRSHGQSRTREYAIWNGMKARCLNPKNRGYPRYGGRGVTVCQEWIDSFEAFIAHIGMQPNDGKVYSLDRIKSHKGYEPGNVRWATKDVQANNTKSNVHITAFGRTQTLAQWSREVGLHHKLITSRINLLGWTPERALSERPGRGRRKSSATPIAPIHWHELQYDSHLID
jgi:hypothetical protein